jgi:hypothetical protein
LPNAAVPVFNQPTTAESEDSIDSNDRDSGDDLDGDDKIGRDRESRIKRNSPFSRSSDQTNALDRLVINSLDCDV